MTMCRNTRRRLQSLTDKIEGATCGLISLLRETSEVPADAVVAEKEAALRAAAVKLMELQAQLGDRDSIITELVEWASAEDCLTIVDKPERVVTHLMRAMVSNRDLRIKQLEESVANRDLQMKALLEENAELKLRPRPETAEKNANDANAALARVRGLEDHLKTLNAANANLLRDRGGALDLLERHTTAWPSADASLDAETRDFLFSCGRRMPKRDDHVRAGPPSPCPPMGTPPLDPNAKIGPCLAPLQPATPGLDAWMRCAQQQLQPINNRVGPGFGKPLDPTYLRTMALVCRRCGDTHTAFNAHTGRTMMCTACPVPCDKCRKDGNGPYCATTPCTCDCHKPKDPQ